MTFIFPVFPFEKKPSDTEVRVVRDNIEIGRITPERLKEINIGASLNYRNYLAQAWTCLAMAYRFCSRALLIVPLLAFWVVAFGIAVDVDAAGAAFTLMVREPAAAAFALKKLLEICFVSSILILVIELCCSPRSMGYQNAFEKDIGRRICTDLGAPWSTAIELWEGPATVEAPSASDEDGQVPAETLADKAAVLNVAIESATGLSAEPLERAVPGASPDIADAAKTLAIPASDPVSTPVNSAKAEKAQLATNISENKANG